MMNHYRNMGGAWSFAMRPYYDENITQEFFNPEFDVIYEAEDMLCECPVFSFVSLVLSRRETIFSLSRLSLSFSVEG